MTKTLDFMLMSLAALLFGAVLTAMTFLVGHLLGWITVAPSALEVTATIFNYACVILCVMRHNANWWLGIVAVILLGILFWQQSLFASMVLSLAFFLPVQITGWMQWSRHLEGSFVSVTKMEKADFAILAPGLVLGAWVIVYAVNTYFGGVLSGWDSAILVLSIVAQLLLNYRRLECWYFWGAVNVLSVYVYGTTGLYLVAFQYMLFLINAANGWYMWRKVARLD